MTDLQEKYADKIAALLNKAESTTPEEAEALTDKAQQLMARYAVEQGMVDERRGKAREAIVEKKITYHSSYHHGLFAIGAMIARAQGCRPLMTRDKNETIMWIVGFESDVERAIMLDASLQIQAQVALRQAVRRAEVHIDSWMTAMEKFKQRRDFLLGFAEGLHDRLERASQIGRDEYRVEAEAAGESGVAEGMELMIRSRADQVNDWIDRSYGTLRTRRSTLSTSYGAARDAGQTAGRNADTGSAGRVGSRRQLTR